MEQGGRGARDRMRVFTLGIVLILAGWGVKHLVVSVITWQLGGTINEPLVDAQRRAEISRETLDNQIEIVRERQRDNPDRDRMSELQRKNRQAEESISKDYIEDEVEASADSRDAQAGMLTSVRWFLWLKLITDVAKIAGVFFVVWGTLGFVNDESVSAPLRWFGVASSTVVLMSILVGGLLTYLA